MSCLGLGSYDWIVFTSANGVRYFFEEFLRIFRGHQGAGRPRHRPAWARARRSACWSSISASNASRRRPRLRRSETPWIATGSLDHGKVLVITGKLNRDALVKAA